MNVRNPMGVLHSFSIKNIFYDKMDVRLFYFDVAKCFNFFKPEYFIPGALENRPDLYFRYFDVI